MIETPGVCRNGSACQVAARGDIVTVPLGAPFVCHLCGTPLAPPVQHTPAPTGAHSPLRPLALGCFALLLAGVAVLAGRMLALQTPAGVAQIGSPTSASHRDIRPPTPGTAPSAPLAAPPAPVALAPKPAAATMIMANPPGPAAPIASEVMQSQPPAPKLLDVRPVALPNPAAGAKASVAHTPPSAPAIAALTPPAMLALVTSKPDLPRMPLPTSPLSAPAGTPAVAAIIDPPFNPVPLAGGAPAYPASLAADGRPGRVVVTCLIMTDGRPQSCRSGLVKGGPAFSAAVLAWLDHGQVRYRPLTQHGRPVAGIRSWPISIDEPAALLAQARQKAQAAFEAAADAPPPDPPRPPSPPAPPAAQLSATAAPVPSRSNIQPVVARMPIAPAAMATLADRPFSTHVLQGGQPEYPAIYTESRPGSVTVRCMIETDGAPNACELVRQSGGSSFGQSVQNWLRFGHVRFAPIIADGHPVSRIQTWTVTFKPPTQ